MSLLKLLNKSLTSLVTPSGVGLILDTFNSSKPMVGTGDISPKKKIRKKPDKKLYMLESPPKNNNLISIDKSLILPTNILTTPLSLTSPAELISKEKALTKFWKPSSTTMSKKLLFTPLIDSRDSDTNLLKTSVNTSIPNSLLTATIKNLNPQVRNYPMTYYQSFRFLPQNITEVENTNQTIQTEIKEVINETLKKDQNLTKISRRIKISPTKKLKLYLNKCFGAYRFFYNKAVKYMKDGYDNKKKLFAERKEHNKCCFYHNNKFTCDEMIYNESNHVNFYCKKHKNQKVSYYSTCDIATLRNNLIPKSENITGSILWQKDIPYDLKQNAIRDIISHISSGITTIKKEGRPFKLHYKIKKNRSQIFRIPSTFIDFRQRTLLENYYEHESEHNFNMSKRAKKWLKSINYKMNNTITIQKENGNYYVYLTYDCSKIKNYNFPHNVVSIDPGVRIFATIYSPDGIEGHIGKDTVDKLITLGQKVDKLTSIKMRKESGAYVKNNRTRRNMDKRCCSIRTKMRNIVENLHKQTINLLCTNFETIIIPKFNVSMKIPKKGRKITNKTVRKMLTLNHGKFMERLKQQSEKIGNKLLIVTEEYTSKTCGKCGMIKKNLGGAKLYKCTGCGVEVDRDINGARNIMIKTITELLDGTKKKMEEREGCLVSERDSNDLRSSHKKLMESRESIFENIAK